MNQRSVYLWRFANGYSGFTHRSIEDLLAIGSLDAGLPEPTRSILLRAVSEQDAPRLEVPDCPFTPGITLRLIRRTAISRMQDVRFGDAGLFVPSVVDGFEEEFELFACRHAPQALSERGRFGTMSSRFDFIPSRVPSCLPFVEENNGMRYLFVDSGFKDAVEASSVTGIRFEKVWSAEEGGFEFRFVDGDLRLVPIAS